MDVNKFSNFQVLDCTIRDGGYINNWQFDKKLVREAYRALSKSGVDYIEIGYRGTEKYFDKNQFGIWRFSPEEIIREVTSNIDGAKLALMADYGKVVLNDFSEAKDSVIDLVRVAANKNSLKDAISLLEGLKKKGYQVSLNAMGYNSYSEQEQAELVDLLRRSAAVDYIYVVDSYGSLFPSQIKPILEPLLGIPDIKVGFHPHNSLQMAFANTLEAIRCGAHIIDTTIYGMGRGAGNLPTEIIIAFLEKDRRDKYNSVPILNIIDRHFTGLQNENKWGYQLSYMLSGMFQCHPNYAKYLVNSHEYTIEDIWKAMEYIQSKNPVGFSESIMRELINEGVMFGVGKNKEAAASTCVSDYRKANRIPSVIPYANRYKGRDFLILANGPSLKEYKDKVEKFINKYNPVVIGANYLGGLFIPDYHAFSNKRRFVAYVDTVNPKSKLLVGQSISDELVNEYTNRDYERIYYVDVLNHDFDITDSVITTNCRTVAVLLLGVAIVMGAQRVFAVGMDGYIHNKAGKVTHFYAEKDEKENQRIILDMHHWCQKFLEQIDAYLIAHGKEGVHILTPTSYRSFYKGLENYI